MYPGTLDGLPGYFGCTDTMDVRRAHALVTSIFFEETNINE